MMCWTTLESARAHWARSSPRQEHWADIRRAAEVASKISGSLEIGQGAVSCAGLILAVEAQEGTDRMLARSRGVASVEIRGTPEARRGVLVKRPKPQQERRIDLPRSACAPFRRGSESRPCWHCS
jgi:DUF1009 family protein